MSRPSKPRGRAPRAVPGPEVLEDDPADPPRFTPAPWRAIFTGWGYSVIVGSDDGPGKEPIASIVRLGLLQRAVDPNYPNVRLIVRAPELFAAAEEAVELLGSAGPPDPARVAAYLEGTRALLAQVVEYRPAVVAGPRAVEG